MRDLLTESCFPIRGIAFPQPGRVDTRPIPFFFYRLTLYRGYQQYWKSGFDILSTPKIDYLYRDCRYIVGFVAHFTVEGTSRCRSQPSTDSQQASRRSVLFREGVTAQQYRSRQSTVLRQSKRVVRIWPTTQTKEKRNLRVKSPRPKKGQLRLGETTTTVRAAEHLTFKLTPTIS